MSQPLSPLSTISANATPGRKISYRSTSPKSSTPPDAENITCHPPSSPFIDIVEYSPAKRRNPSKTFSPEKSPEKHQSTPLTENALKENEGLVQAARSAQAAQASSDSSSGTVVRDAGEDTMISEMDEPSDYPGMDDTHFTAFSAVPNVDMTEFARNTSSPAKSLRSPTKSLRKGYSEDTPPRSRPVTPSNRRFQSYDEGSASPTPRRPKSSHGDTTNLLVDFTEQFNAFASHSNRSPNRLNRSPPKSQTQPNLAQYTNGLRTPSPVKSRNVPGTPSGLANLLDFDLPPAPTPRSIPTITARELESLKSSFLSQISSLRATLSGKEAEINSLKDAVGDAERRVGEAMEELRDEKGTRESLQAGKLDWEKREEEMQGVLRSVKQEIIREEHEKEQLRHDLEKSERKREVAETRAIEAESKAAGLQTPSSAIGAADAAAHNKTVDAAVERVAQELHALYKNKHEDKVKALKKSYQARWEKKIHDLESRLHELSQENEELRLGRDATISGVIPPSATQIAAEEEARIQERAAEAQRFEQQAARMAGLEAEVKSVNSENSQLLVQLERSRGEMADLVAATEEMMQLSVQQSSVSASEDIATSSGSTESMRAPFSRSLSSGLKAPGSGFGGESRIGKMNFGASGGSGSGSGSGSAMGRSGIMRSIERMGSGRSHE